MTLVVLPTDRTSTFTNTGAAGVNRVVAFDDVLLVDNIGRNFEIRKVGGEAEPTWIQQVLYDVTIFPGEDNPSILDSDVHGAFLTDSGAWLMVVNHFGRVRCFEWPFPDGSASHRPSPGVELHLPGDTERLAFDGTCFVTSSPRGAYTPDAAQPGIFISEPVVPLLARSRPGGVRYLECHRELDDWGFVTALAFDRRQRRLAVAAGTRLAVFGLDRGNAATQLAQPQWEMQTSRATQWLAFDAQGRLVVAGHDGVTGDDEGTEWDGCRGGTLTVIAPDGHEVARGALPDATAWGYGSDAIVLSADGRAAYVVDRFAGVHAIDLGSGAAHFLHQGVAATEATPLGIGHAVRLGRYLYAGFSRGGYRVFRTALP
jgi:hypothetical protein